MDIQHRRANIVDRARRALEHWLQNRQTYVNIQVGSSIALGIGLLFSVVLSSGWLEPIQTRFSDLLYQPLPPTGKVVLIAIDDASVKEMGGLPLSRAKIADLINAITQAEPQTIGLYLTLTASPDADAALAQALRRAPSIIMPITPVASAPIFQIPNVTLGHSIIVPDQDGVVRHIPVIVEASEQAYTAFGIAMLESDPQYARASQIQNDQIQLGATTLVLDTANRMRVNFVSPAARPVISAAAVLHGDVARESLRDKIVLIGLTGVAASENFQTPLSMNTRRVAGVEIQTDVIETILGNRQLVKQDRLNEILMVFMVALLAGATIPHVRLLSAFALAIIYFLMYLGYAFQKFNDGILVQPLYPLLALFFTFALTMTFRYFSIDRPRTFISRMFRHSVQPESVDRVLTTFDNGALPLQGARRDVTVMYVDLRDLRVLTESLNAEEMIQLLNQYVARIIAIVFQHDGFVTEQAGDTTLAVWNLVLNQPDHAHLAARAAMEIKREARRLARELIAETRIEIGIGVSSGNIVAGRIATPRRAEFAVIGEVVTLAERMAMKTDRGVFVDPATRAVIADEFETQQVNPIRLRRQTDPQIVWEIIEPVEVEEQVIPTEEPVAQPN